MSDSYDVLKTLNQEELIARLLHQEEEIRMGRAFSNIAEDVGNDATLQWQGRNPSRTGYGIPIAEFGAETENFYPDLLLWTDSEIWAIDPKGSHLKEGAAQTKLFDVTNVSGVATPLRVALILEGHHTVTAQEKWISDKKAAGFTLARRTSAGTKCQTFSNLPDLLQSLLNN